MLYDIPYVHKYLENYRSTGTSDSPIEYKFGNKTEVDYLDMDSVKVPVYINEFWTSKQRQASSIHEISYRACFKPQLPSFFIKLLSTVGDTVYDPFAGRGTTVIEAALQGRRVISNDINPLSRILTEPRFFIPDLKELERRLYEIPIDYGQKAEIDLSMFYHPDTEAEIVSLRNYLQARKESGTEDLLDKWIRMVATNRLTGHSRGFFSVYTLPPNQAVTPERQKKINERLGQKPEYRDTRKIIMKKSRSLIRNLTPGQISSLRRAGESALFLERDARSTPEIPNGSVNLTVTSPPFLDIVQYHTDNWLRCWFNGIDVGGIAEKITVMRSVGKWAAVMEDVLRELYRITSGGGWVAFEVGEVRKGRIELDRTVVPLGLRAGFDCAAVVINLQKFTKTSNIWGIKNNKAGTNTNRIVLFVKR